MNVLNLGKLPDHQSVLIFHALARMGYEGLVTVSPTRPIVSVGYFQDTEKEIDTAKCTEMGIPFMRREVGGGATLLDENQVFYHVIWNRKNSKFPTKIKDILRFLSQAPIDTYGEFGIKTRFHGENDIVTHEGRKIAGEAGGDIGDSMVFVGGILMDFDYDLMPKVLRVPDEKYRDKIHKSLEANLTTMKREIGEMPDRDAVVKTLNNSFSNLIGPLKEVSIDSTVIRKMLELEQIFTSDRVLYKKTPKIPKGVKIAEGIEILYGIYKSRGGLIRNVQQVEHETIKEIDFSGDFQLFPKNSISNLGSSLNDTKRDKGKVIDQLSDFYESNKIESPGVTPEDLSESVFSSK